MTVPRRTHTRRHQKEWCPTDLAEELMIETSCFLSVELSVEGWMQEMAVPAMPLDAHPFKATEARSGLYMTLSRNWDEAFAKN